MNVNEALRASINKVSALDAPANDNEFDLVLPIIKSDLSRSLRPADNWQGEDRMHRSGQSNACVYKPLVMRGTVDERVEQLLANRTDLRTKIQDMSIEDIYNLV